MSAIQEKNADWIFVSGSNAWPTSSTFNTSKQPTTPVQWSTSWDVTPAVQKMTISAKKVPPKNPPTTFTDSLFANDSFFSGPPTSSITPAAPKQPISTSTPTPIPSPTSAPVEEDKQIEEEISKQNLYKTELCRSFRDTGACRYGHKCQFAHGEHELRALLRHPKYKTEICKTFATTAHCPYGNRCRFIHTDVNGQPITLPATNQVNNVSASVSIPNSTCEDEDFSQSQIYPNQYPPKLFHSSSPQQNTPASSPKSHTSPFAGVQFQSLDKNNCGFKSSKSGWGVNVTQVEFDQSPEEKERENDSPEESRRLAVFQRFTVQ